MRTSGASTESNMVLAVGVIVLLTAMVLAGGPRELLIAMEKGMQAGAEAIYQTWLRIAG